MGGGVHAHPAGGFGLGEGDQVPQDGLGPGERLGGLADRVLVAGAECLGVGGKCLGVPDDGELNVGVLGQGEGVVVGADVVDDAAGVAGPGGAVLGLGVDVLRQAGPGGDAHEQPAHCLGLVADGDVDAAGALHIDDQHVARFPGVLYYFFESFLTVCSLVKEPFRVDRGVLDALARSAGPTGRRRGRCGGPG